jgi:hypothetical protein
MSVLQEEKGSIFNMSALMTAGTVGLQRDWVVKGLRDAAIGTLGRGVLVETKGVTLHSLKNCMWEPRTEPWEMPA